MRRVTSGVGLLCCCAAILIGAAGRAGAQASATAFPVTPDPAACLGTARPVEDLIAILTTPLDPATTIQPPTEAIIPLGEPVAPEIAAAITESVQGVIACLNAGDMLRAAAFFTDAGLRTLLTPWVAERVWTEAEVRALTGEAIAPPADERQTLMGVAGIATLANGRAGAIVVVADPYEESGQLTALYLTFAQGSAAGWLIDDLDPLSRE